ncbi:calmodulin [Gregarina niphandrodes]|uniref:Calmodulin n=1 Tax=Gregarina niphandrodes TaxID=110365 RepID=A0A023BCE6_GRENI|nr:calmodulin [Gregarina niphandrodes]EZG82440.1 calmodulin [Gregarina niphandrodes]|eukprot:XP_011129009.1 calmodulin [Gregarina niphandrodes]
MAEISEQDLKCIQEALGIGWDRTGADLGVVLRSAGYRVSEEEAQEISKELDVKPSDPLTATTVCMAAGKVKPENQARKVMLDAFKCMDKFGDGTITMTDLRLVLTNMGDIKQDELDMIIEEVDPDDVGRVYLEDVYRIFLTKNLLS